MKEYKVCLLSKQCGYYKKCKDEGALFVKKCIICHEEVNEKDELSLLVTLVFIDENNILYAGKGKFKCNLEEIDKCSHYVFNEQFLELGDIRKLLEL